MPPAAASRKAALRRGGRKCGGPRRPRQYNPKTETYGGFPETPSAFRRLWQTGECRGFVKADLTRVLLVSETVAAVLAPSETQLAAHCLACPTHHGSRNMDCCGQRIIPAPPSCRAHEETVHSPLTGRAVGYVAFDQAAVPTAHQRLTEQRVVFRPIHNRGCISFSPR